MTDEPRPVEEEQEVVAEQPEGAAPDDANLRLAADIDKERESELGIQNPRSAGGGTRSRARPIALPHGDQTG